MIRLLLTSLIIVAAPVGTRVQWVVGRVWRVSLWAIVIVAAIVLMGNWVVLV